MIYKFSSEEERIQMRRSFFSDDVYIIAHKVLPRNRCSLCLEEVFCSAENIVNILLEYEITESDLIDDEIDDLKQKCEDQDAAYLILFITFIKLCALRKTKPLAGTIAKAMVHRLQENEGFTDLLKDMAKVEQKRIVEKGRIDLLRYELRTIEKNKANHDIINKFIDSVLMCGEEVISSVITPFSIFNSKSGNLYDAELSRLNEGYLTRIANQNQPTEVYTQGGPAIMGGEFRDNHFISHKQLESK